MPEGPEVRHACTMLDLFAGTAENAKVSKITNFSKDGITDIWDELIGQTFRGTRRKGKVWVLDFDTHSLVGHFAMWGYFELNKDRKAKHVRKQIDFDNGLKIRYCDMRNWGKMTLCLKDQAMEHPSIKKLGIDVSQPFSHQEVFDELRKHGNWFLADALLSQQIIAGLGNIWRAEAIGREGLDAMRTIDELSDSELSSLITQIDTIMNNGGNAWIEIYRQNYHSKHAKNVICTHRNGRRLWHLEFTTNH